MMAYVGGCSCGAVRYEITAEPIRGFQCQCRDCQRDSGSGHTSVWVFPRTAFKATGPLKDSVRVADSGDAKVKCFCEVCGSPICNKPVAKPDMLGLYVGSLDDPSGFRPHVVMFASRGNPWDFLDPEVPRIAGMRN